jgi:hypothetical protein
MGGNIVEPYQAIFMVVILKSSSVEAKELRLKEIKNKSDVRIVKRLNRKHRKKVGKEFITL